MELVGVVGTVVSAVGTIAGGMAAKDMAEHQAAQMEREANTARAIGSREAMDKRKEQRFLLSKLQARAAASGGAADDPTVVDLAGDVAQRGEYEALVAMYRGENRARGMEDQAALTRVKGQADMTGGILKGVGTLAGAAPSMRKILGYG